MHIKYELTIAEKNIGVKVKSESIFIFCMQNDYSFRNF